MKIAVFIALGLVACGGPPREARLALEQTAGGLVVADELVAAAVERRGEEARVQVRREVREGAIAGDSREETIAAGLARFDELLQPLTDARSVLRTVDRSLRVVEGALDSWAAGSGEGGFFAAAACAAAALAQLSRALAAAGVDLPEALSEGVRLLGAFASGACPEGGS